MLARAGASDVREQHHACGRPTIRELEARAPERVAAGRIPAIAANRAGTAEIPVALDRDDTIGHAARQLDRTGDPRTKWCGHPQRAAHAPKPVRPHAAIDRHIGGPLRPLGIDSLLRAQRQRRPKLVGGVRTDVGTEDVILVQRVRKREVGALERPALTFGVQADLEALRECHRGRDRQLGACRVEVVAVVAAQHQSPKRIPDRERSRGRIDRGKAPITLEPDACCAGLAQDTSLEIGLAIGRGDARGAVEL